MSFITYGGNCRFSTQYDLFDIANQMHLCDELDLAGLQNPKLRTEWVAPTLAPGSCAVISKAYGAPHPSA